MVGPGRAKGAGELLVYHEGCLSLERSAASRLEISCQQNCKSKIGKLEEPMESLS